MRITHSVVTHSFNRNLSNNLKRVQKYHEQLSTGKLINRPSDDPLLVGKIMSLDTNIKQNTTHNKIIGDSLNWVATQDTALQSANNSLLRIRDLMIQGATGTLSEEDRQSVNAEIESEMEHFVDVLNTNYDGRYIFSGQETTTKPFKLERSEVLEGAALTEKLTTFTTEEEKKAFKDSMGKITGLSYLGDKNDIPREIAQGVSINLKTNGSALVGNGDGNGSDIGKLFEKISTAMHSGLPAEVENLGGDYLDEIDKFSEEVVRIRTQIGSIDNRLSSAKERNISENLHLKDSLSQKEDIDLAEKYMEFITMSSVYQASLSVGAKIMQPTLLDYMR